MPGSCFSSFFHLRPSISYEGKIELEPNSSSILKSWLYFATLSVLEREPVLIWPEPIDTAKSEIIVSSVSPDL